MPDGLGDFVNALNNPKEFVTKEEKRLKQLQDKLGIDEKEISVIPVNKSMKSSSIINNNAPSAQNSNEKNKKDLINSGTNIETEGSLVSANNPNAGSSNKKDEPSIEKISRDTLKSMKGFQKLLKKQTKEKEVLKKKHNKEKAFMQKQHSSIIDKMTVSFDKTSSGTNNTSNPIESLNNTDENNFRQKMKDIVDDQTKIWATLIERQQTEDKQLNNEQVEQQCLCFQQLLIEAQKQRKKDMELRQKKFN